MTTSQLAEPIVVTIKSHSQANKTYTVTFPTNEQPYCTCVGFGYRRTCSHIKEAADQLLDQLISSQLAIQPASARASVCLTCGVALSGTHAFLNKCAACYRHETLGTSKPHASAPAAVIWRSDN